MIVAKEKREKNIAEYILYMWQVEDLIRAYGLDIEAVKSNVIPQYNASGELLTQIVDWYDNLIEMMRLENIKESGHLQVLINLVNDLNRLHLELLANKSEVAYSHLYNATLPYIKEFDSKTESKLSNDVELCLTGIYSHFLLRLQKKKISDQTQEAIKSFSNFMAFLSSKYHEEQDKEENENIGDVSLN